MNSTGIICNMDTLFTSYPSRHKPWGPAQMKTNTQNDKSSVELRPHVCDMKAIWE